jgi:VWFA-related protein
MLKTIKSYLSISLLFALVLCFGFTTTKAASPEQVKVVTVTVKANNKVTVPELGRDDFLVSEEGTKQEILSVSPATSANAPINLAVVVEEGSSQINSELDAIKEFINSLPTGSQVMVTYLRGNFVQTAQSFTTNLSEAGKSLHVVSTSSNAPASPYLALIDVMKQFNGMQKGRNQILFISNGVDGLGFSGFSPSSNIYLERAIKIAQQENISIYSLFAGGSTSRRGAFIGQNNLSYLSEETGGYAFTSGLDGFVTFDSPLKQFREILDNQYVITYKSSNDDKGFRRVKVTTDFSNIKVTAPKGYVASK